MISRYSIIRYLPRPLTGECINIGIIVFSDDTKEIRIQFLRDWKRVRCFAAENIDFLRDFVDKAPNEITSKLLDTSYETNIYEAITRLSKTWFGSSIQISDPKVSTKDVTRLFDEISLYFLVEPENRKTEKIRNRQDAKRITVLAIKKALEAYEIKELLSRESRIQGSRGKVEFDAVIANGKPLFAAHGLSFEVDEPEQTLESLAWRIEGVKRYDQNFPIGIMMLKPKDTLARYEKLQESYEEAEKTYIDLGATVIPEIQVEAWAVEQIRSVVLTGQQ